MNEMRKLMEAVAALSEEPLNYTKIAKDALDAPLPKSKVTKKPKTGVGPLTPSAVKKIYVYGECEDKRISGSISGKFFSKWVASLETGNDTANQDLQTILRDKAGFKFYNGFAEALYSRRSDDIELMKEVLAGGSAAFEQDSASIGLGPNKRSAMARYEETMEDLGWN